MSHAQGGCLCGAVRYEISAEPIFQVACHCRDCQYAAGGAPSLIVVVPRAAFRVTKGAARTYSSLGDSGAPVERNFCPDCGTPLWSEPKGIGDFIALKVGGLDDPSAFRP